LPLTHFSPRLQSHEPEEPQPDSKAAKTKIKAAIASGAIFLPIMGLFLLTKN
jgi:hypothetical protein